MTGQQRNRRGKDRREGDEKKPFGDKDISDLTVREKEEQGQSALFLFSDRSAVPFNDPVVECIPGCFCHALR